MGDDLTEKAVGYAVTHGLCMGKKGNDWGLTNCPFMLEPCRIPKHLFDKARQLSPVFNAIIDAVARDYEFLRETLEATGKADAFTGSLLDIHEKVYKSGGRRGDLMLGLHRADYMLHCPGDQESVWELQQVEINTIASAFGGLSPLTNKLHRYLSMVKGEDPAAIPISESDEQLAKGLASAFERHLRELRLEDVRASCRVLFVVQQGETNAFDQRILEQKLVEAHGINVVRRSLQELSEQASLDPSTGNLLLRSEGITCLVAYFRAGYTPNDYPEQRCWDARLILEQSTAVKCPSIPYQLVGTKKMQQVLCDKVLLSRFLPKGSEGSVVENIMSVFAPMSGLEDGPEQNAIIQKALKAPDDWLLKPQREGGGSLIFGEAMTKILSSLTPSQRDEFILMKKIKPPPFKGACVRDGRSLPDSFIAELGIYGVFLGDSSRAVLNEYGGHLVRSKPDSQHDGGVAAGVASLDSVCIF